MRSMTVEFEVPMDIVDNKITVIIGQYNDPTVCNIGISWTKKDGSKMLEERPLTFEKFEELWGVLAAQPTWANWAHVAESFRGILELEQARVPEMT